MFNFGNANENQRRAISTVDGPVLITAGPGTGKTFTLVQRAIYLIQERGVRPEEILMATFTEKAAKELVTRITNELAARKISANINEMYPDFLAKLEDGSYQLIEVKGDNMIDDVIVQAKKNAALEMAIASGIEYIMYPGSLIMKSNVLEASAQSALV